jgi:hypothetical protein
MPCPSISTRADPLLQQGHAEAAAGLIGEDGLPTGLDGVDNFKAALQKLKDGGKYGLSIHSTAGDSQWRIFYSLLGQQDGQFLEAPTATSCRATTSTRPSRRPPWLPTG